MSMIKLEDLEERGHLEFISGQILSRMEYREGCGKNPIGKVEVIPPVALNEKCYVNAKEKYEIQYISEYKEERLTKYGDILIKFSMPYDAAVVTEDAVGLLVTSFNCIIRPKLEYIDPFYLVAFLNSSLCKRQLAQYASGAGRPLMTIGRFKELRIKEFPMAEQKQIATYYRNMAMQQEIFRDMLETEMKIIESVLGEHE